MATREQKTQAQPTHAEAPALDMDAMLEEAGRALLAVQAAGRDTSFLSVEKKAAVLEGLARALGLNPLSQPVIFLKTQGREVVYVTKVGTDQIASRLRLQRRTIHGPDVRKVHGKDLAFCQVEVTAPDGRSEMSTATLPITDPVNDLMKVESKAKRRATLSIAGLGLLTEEEIETIPGAHHAARSAAQPAPQHEEHQGDGAEGALHDAPAQEQADVPSEVPAQLRAFLANVAEIELPGEGVAVWRMHRAGLAVLPGVDREAAWKAVCARVETVGKMHNAKVWLKKAIAEEDARLHAASTVGHGAALDGAGDTRAETPRNATEQQAVLGSLDDAPDVTELRRRTVSALDAYPAMSDAVWTHALGAAGRLGCDEETFRRMVAEAMGDGPQPPAGGAGGNAPGGNASARGTGRSGAQGAATTQRAANDVTPLRLVSDAAQGIIERHGLNPFALRNALKKHREELYPSDVPELARVLAKITPPDPLLKGAKLTQVGAEKIVCGLTGLRSAA